VTIWMLRNFVAAVPREMEEAAAIDGAGPMRIFWRIMLPLVLPAWWRPACSPSSSRGTSSSSRWTFLGTDTAKIHAAHLRDVLLRPRHGGLGSIMASSTLFTIPC